MQIWTQCRFALLAIDALAAAIADMARRRNQPDARYDELVNLPFEQANARAAEIALDDSVRAWHPIQSFLTAIANISKALWGQGGKLAAERRDLRDSLDVDDTSPLQPTSMRNHFDHFDERLDEWWKRSEDHNYVDLRFGDVGSQIHGIPEDEMFRSFDPASGDLVFWGQRYNLPAIIDEIRKIMPLALEGATTV
jgi:hypothetical protein